MLKRKRIQPAQQGVLLGTIVALMWIGVGVLHAAAPGTVPDDFEWTFEPLAVSQTVIELPPRPGAPITLQLDDGSTEGSFGVGATTAEQFLWFNQFSRSDDVILVEEIHVLFPAGPNIMPGDAIQVVVYLDPDGDPTNGANLLTAFDDVIQFVDGSTLSVYTLDPPLPVLQPGDLLVGVVSRFVTSGVSLPVSLAAIDTTMSQGRSWFATWIGDPPAIPELPSDSLLVNIDILLPGNWMIRVVAGPGPSLDVPTLGGVGLSTLAILLASVGAIIMRRRRAGAFVPPHGPA